MIFWPRKDLYIESGLTKEEVIQELNNATDQDQKSIYWGKRFKKRFWGKVGRESFRVRPVVPYWNISPLEIKGEVKAGKDEKGKVDIKMVCPYLRIVIPLVILALVLFFVNFGMKGDMDIFLSSPGIIVLSAYLLVNIPFQIQSIWSIKHLTENLRSKSYRVK